MSPMLNIFGWCQCCVFAMATERNVLVEAEGTQGLAGFETVLLPWKLEGSHIKLDQGPDDTECPLLCSQTCGPVQRIGWEMGGDKQ